MAHQEGWCGCSSPLKLTLNKNLCLHNLPLYRCLMLISVVTFPGPSDFRWCERSWSSTWTPRAASRCCRSQETPSTFTAHFSPIRWDPWQCLDSICYPLLRSTSLQVKEGSQEQCLVLELLIKAQQKLAVVKGAHYVVNLWRLSRSKVWVAQLIVQWKV